MLWEYKDFSLQPPLGKCERWSHLPLFQNPFLRLFGKFFEKFQVFFILHFCFKTLSIWKRTSARSEEDKTFTRSTGISQVVPSLSMGRSLLLGAYTLGEDTVDRRAFHTSAMKRE